MIFNEGTYLIELVLFAAIVAGSIPYLLFPLAVRLIHFLVRPIKTSNAFDIKDESLWPAVDLIFAAYNEAAVLREKLDNLSKLSYPNEKLTIWVGSDMSTDETDSILEEFAEHMPNLRWERMPIRSGKSAIINHLIKKGSASIIVGTDANIFFHKMALKHLVAPLVTRPHVALVGAELAYRGIPLKDSFGSIAKEERSYIQWENRTKVCEGELWGLTMGVEGGCYAIRRTASSEIPKGTLMEDFYLSVRVLAKGLHVHHAALATCTEDVSNSASMEYNRKVRISHGNWQNIVRFKLPFRARSIGIFLVFACHKLFRWFFPLALLLATGYGLIHLVMLRDLENLLINVIAFGLMALIILIPRYTVPPFLAKRLKPISYFVWMNLALLHGLWRFIVTNPKSVGIWQPTKRNNQ